LIFPERKDPLDLGIDLCIHQLDQERAVRVAGPWIPPHCLLPPPECLDTMANEGVEEAHARQPILEQTLEDVLHGLQLMGVFLSHPIPPAGLDGGVPTRDCKEWCAGVVP
jgi:hypothetical protein